MQGYRSARARLIEDPTTLVIIDEADRLRTDSLEQARSLFDEGGIGLVLIGMPGLEKRMARYPQLYSRVGFVHQFEPLDAAEMCRILHRHWTPRGVTLPFEPWSEEAYAAILRITGGNFRLLSQTERVLEINGLKHLTKEQWKQLERAWSSASLSASMRLRQIIPKLPTPNSD